MQTKVLIAWALVAAFVWAAFTALEARAQSGTIQFSAVAYSAKESAGAAKITVSRVGGSAGTVTVDFATVETSGGTAAAGVDYFPTNGTLTFGPGVTSRFFYVPIIHDHDHELDETVILELQRAVGGTLG